MKYLTITLASLAIAVGVLGTLMVLVFAMASGANSTPEQIRLIKLVMLTSGIVGVGCVVGGIVLIVKGFPGWASLVGALPMIFVFVMMVWLTVRSGR